MTVTAEAITVICTISRTLEGSSLRTRLIVVLEMTSTTVSAALMISAEVMEFVMASAGHSPSTRKARGFSLMNGVVSGCWALMSCCLPCR